MSNALHPEASSGPLDTKAALKKAVACERNGEFSEAAEYYLSAGEASRAAVLFLRADNHRRAAEIYLGQGEWGEAAKWLTRAGDWTTLADLHAQRRVIASDRSPLMAAADLYIKAGRPERAAECFERLGLHARAALLWSDAGQVGRAAQQMVDEWEQFIRCQPSDRLIGNRHADNLALQAAKLLDRAGETETAALFYERAERWDKAARLYEKIERVDKAAELFEKAGLARESARLLRLLGQDRRAARILAEQAVQGGELGQAAELFQSAGDLALAAQAWERVGEYAKAATLYEKLEEHERAAQCHVAIHQWLPAAQCFEKAGNLLRAAQLYGQLGDRKRQAALIAQLGRFFEAGRLFREEGETQEAIRCFQRVGSSDPSYREACRILGNAFRDQGLFELSVEKLGEAIGDREMTHADLDLFYELARSHQEAGNLSEAYDLYHRILALDVRHRDAQERAAEVKKAMSTRRPETGGDLTMRGDYDPNERTALLDETQRLHSQRGENRYTRLEELGRGGMGVVYKAKDNILGRTVALKILPSEQIHEPEILRSFIREAQSAAALAHENIVHIYDAGVESGVYFIAMEYVKGRTLKQMLKETPIFATKLLILIAGQLARALEYAHGMKIVHRDIKSSNAMWTEDKKVKLMDFGLAKVIEGVRAEQTLISGTPYYMSPEQTLGIEIDHRTDIYSLGVTLYELATGKVPFKSGDIGFHHVHTAPVDPREIQPEVPEMMTRLILKCLAKKPEDRFQSASEVFEALKDASRSLTS